MQSELKSLSKIFTESIFRIPDYQRGYSWSKKHLKDFWGDIDQLQDGKGHYTGVLTLEPVPQQVYQTWEDDLWIIESKRYQPYYVVDGQQRLTTAIVLLQVILEQAEGDLNYTPKSEIQKKYIFESKDSGISRSYLFGYERDNPSYEYLKKQIFKEVSENHSLGEETIYTKNLEAAKKFFTDQVKGMSPSKLESIFTRITQYLSFNIFIIEPQLDVFVTFETMNNRGKPLSHLELLKNRLIYLSTRINADDVERKKLRKVVNESWKTIYHFLGKSNNKKLSDDIFLKTHFVSYFPPDFEEGDLEAGADLPFRHYIYDEDDYKEKLLDEIFTARRIGAEKNPLILNEIYDYAQDIKSAVEVYFDVCAPAKAEIKLSEKTVLS